MWPKREPAPCRSAAMARVRLREKANAISGHRAQRGDRAEHGVALQCCSQINSGARMYRVIEPQTSISRKGI